METKKWSSVSDYSSPNAKFNGELLTLEYGLGSPAACKRDGQNPKMKITFSCGKTLGSPEKDTQKFPDDSCT